MKYFNNTLCISHSDLVNREIISLSDYTNFRNRGKLNVVRRGCRGTEALIEVDSLPEAVIGKIKQIYGEDYKQQALANPLKNFLENDNKAFQFFDNYKKPDGSRLAADKVREYTANAVALNAIIKLLNDRQAYRKALGGSAGRSDSYKAILAALKALQPEWGWNLPGSERNLRARIAKYKSESYASLIHGNDGNDHAAKVKDTEQMALLRSLMSNPRNYNDVQVRDMYNEVAKNLGWKKVSEKTVGKRRVEWKLFIDPTRKGEANFFNNIAMQQKRKAPVYPMLFWTLDGWDAELLYQKTTTNEKGHSVTTYHNRLVLEVVLDPCTKYPIGYAIGVKEDTALIKKALRNALKHTAELFGAVFRPQQIQSDNFSIKSMRPFIEAISPRFTPARVKNAKSKVIEPYFRYFNQNYCQFAQNWAGFGVKASEDNQPNVDNLNLIKKNFPDLAGCAMQLSKMVEADREKKREQYLEAWALLPEDYKLPWNHEQYLYYTGETRLETNSFEGQGLVTKLMGQKRFYDSFDINFRRHMHTNWSLRYDPQDLSTVLATNNDGTLRFLLEEKHNGEMDLLTQNDQTATAKARVHKFNKELMELIQAQSAADWRETEALFSLRPELDDTTAKMQLVDSEGQHKIYSKPPAIAAASEIAADTILKEEKEEAKALDALRKEQQSKRDEYLKNKVDLSKYL